jgi:glycerol-3-phosphate O-acyltransferase
MKQTLKRWLTKFNLKLGQSIGRVLDGTHDHYSCFIPEKIGFLSSLLLKLFYSGISLDENQTAAIRQIEKDAIVVYATKFANYFELLFYYQRFRQLGFRFPQIVFDYNVIAWQPISRLLKIIVAHIDFFLHFWKLPNPYARDYIRRELLSGRAGYLSLVDKTVFYRRFVKARTDPIQYLITMQKSINRPVYIFPLLMFFTKKPHRPNPSLIDIIFGPEDRPGIIRRVATLFKNPGTVFVEISEPVHLRRYLEAEEIGNKSIEHQALILRRNLLVQLNRHRQTITGPIIKSRQEFKEGILTSERFQKFLSNYSQNRDIPIKEVHRRADAYLEEIAANYSPMAIRIYSAMVQWIIYTMFDGVSVNYDGLNKVKSMSLKGPLILIPCHKSHIDYLILSYLMYHHNMPCPLVAAGKNLSFWPMGPLFRSGGAFFIRRSMRGAVLYSRVLAEYIRTLLEEGYNLEQFIEGGRSRTGKLLMPKLGLLSMLLNAYKNGACRDMIFVPIYIGYDRVLEEKSYLDELEGGQKRPETLRQVIKARKFLKRRYGKIYIQFHDPLSLNELLQQQAKPLAEMDSTEQSALCRNLGHRVIHAISRVAVVTPHALAAAALLNCVGERLSSVDLMSIVETYLRYLATQNATFSDTLAGNASAAVRQALDSYVQRKFIEPVVEAGEDDGRKTVYRINVHRRPHLEYYKNNCIAYFVPAAFTALAILGRAVDRFSSADLRASYSFLQDLFKYEFSYDADQLVDHYVHKSIKAFIDDALLIPHPTLPDTYSVNPTGLSKLKLFAAFLKTYFESYWIVLNFFRQYPPNVVKTKDRLKKIADKGQQLYIQGKIERKEALNKISYQNAVDFFISRGLKGPDNRDKLEYYAQAIKQSLKYLKD